MLQDLGPRAGCGEFERTDAPLRCADETFTEQTRMESEPDRDSRAAALELARRNRLVGDEEVMKPAGAGQSRGIGHIEEVARIREKFLCMFLRQKMDKSPGTRSGPALEEALEMVLAQIHAPGYFAQRRLTEEVLPDEPQSALNALVILSLPGGLAM